MSGTPSEWYAVRAAHWTAERDRDARVLPHEYGEQHERRHARDSHQIRRAARCAPPEADQQDAGSEGEQAQP